MDLGLEEDEVAGDGVDLPMPGGMALRDYQIKALEAIGSGWATYSRQLVVMATGLGKTVVAAHVIKREIARGGRVLFLAHTEELLDQAADKFMKACGIESEREKADDYAGLGAKVVVASIQTISKEARLMAFPDNHFSLVICDEAHRSLSATYLRVMRYYHFGEESLEDSWVMPEPGAPYKPKARCLGITATEDRGDRRSLGQWYDHCCFEWNLLNACREGYLVRPVVKNLPLKIDIKGVKMRGNDLDAKEVSDRLTPLLREIAKQLWIEAKDRKTIVFLPSVDAARRLAEACAAEGFNASFVSGACIDRPEKVAAFHKAGIGTMTACAMLLTEGFDCPDVSCICILRPTKIRSLMVQCCGRASRTLSGVIDGLATKEERLAAIAASAKPDMLILDFLWLSDRLDLIKPVDLVATRADMKDRMDAMARDKPAYDLLDLEGVATRDLLKSLEAAARKNANKAKRVFDPLSWAVDLGDEKLATYEPETAFDARPPTKGQIDLLTRQHFDVTKVNSFGLASLVIGKLMHRYRLSLASPQQLHFLHQLGLPADKASLLTASEASLTIDRVLAEKKARRAATSAPSESA